MTKIQNGEVSINPTWEQSCEREPLLKFSLYLVGRVNVLLDLSDEIIRNLDQGFADSKCIHSAPIERAESLVWLWILGAYEVVRTMCQARDCFSQRLQDQLFRLKKELAYIRMPAAKMEKAGKKAPVSSNRSPTGWDPEKLDLLVNDPDSTQNISARDLKNVSAYFLHL
jgi:hypothetical protein